MLSKDTKSNLILVLGVASVLALISATSLVGTGKVGVVTRFGKVTERTLESGINFKLPLIEHVKKIDVKINSLGSESQASTSDNQSINYNISVNYKLNENDVSELYRNIGNNKSINENIIQNNITEATKVVFSKYNSEEIMENRDKIADVIREELQEKLNTATDIENSIIVTSVQIDNFSFSEEYTKAKEEKVVAKQRLLTEQQNTQIKQEQAEQAKIDAHSNADTEIIKAQGQAKANEIRNNSITDKTLQQDTINKWDGKTPLAVGSGQGILDLSKYNDR